MHVCMGIPQHMDPEKRQDSSRPVFSYRERSKDLGVLRVVDTQPREGKKRRTCMMNEGCL